MMPRYTYLIRVTLADGSVKAFGYPTPTDRFGYKYSGPGNTWVLAGEKMKLAEEYGVDPDSVIVHHRDHGAIL
jgi:hypothetical protein